MGPLASADKNSEPKEVHSDNQHQRNQRTCIQHAHLQGQSLKKHRYDSGNRKELSAEARQPSHGHSVLWVGCGATLTAWPRRLVATEDFTCHATQQPEQVLGKEAHAQRRRCCGG